MSIGVLKGLLKTERLRRKYWSNFKGLICTLNFFSKQSWSFNFFPKVKKISHRAGLFES